VLFAALLVQNLVRRPHGVAPDLPFAHATMKLGKRLDRISRHAGSRLQWLEESTWNGEVIGLFEGFILSAICYVCFSTKCYIGLHQLHHKKQTPRSTIIHFSFLQLNPTDTSLAFPCVPSPVSDSVPLHSESKGPNHRFRPTHLLACYCCSA
jgi:hypothetical protein